MKNWRGKAIFGVSLVICGAGAFSSFSGCTSEPTNVISGGAGTSATGTGAAGTSATGAAGTSATGAAGTSATGAAGTSATGSAGTSATGSAGTTAQAGTSGGGAGTGAAGTAAAGTTGAGGTAAGGICTPMSGQFDCNNVLPGMDGYLNRDDANGPSQGSDAIQLNCTTSDVPNMQKIYKEKHWQLKGPGITAGTMYKVDLHIYGVVECKTYVGGTGPAKTDPNETPNVSQTHNLWLAGSRDNGDHWNTYAFTVTPMSMSTLVGIGPQTGVMLPPTASTYVINQCPGNRGEGHFTFNLDFPASITVPGESWINYIEYDTNCRLIANCGAAEATQTCPGPYNVVNTVKMSVPNTNAQFTQPIANTANPPSRGQWWYVDVAGVTAM